MSVWKKFSVRLFNKTIKFKYETNRDVLMGETVQERPVSLT